MPEKSEAGTPERVRLGDRLFVLVEDAIYVVIAVLLAVSAAVVLVRASLTLVDSATSDGSDAMVEVLDRLLLVFIFVELLYAVRTTLKERQIVAEPFLVAGILTAIKEIIVLSVKAPSEYLDKGPEFARAMVEIGLLGVLVLVLAASAVLLRAKEKEPEEGSNDRSVA
ncbi:MAG: hypothetical protein JWO60_2970 [Frankiales bacterium]|nr:hypothetical protein [Frankiales bacterium]